MIPSFSFASEKLIFPHDVKAASEFHIFHHEMMPKILTFSDQNFFKNKKCKCELKRQFQSY